MSRITTRTTTMASTVVRFNCVCVAWSFHVSAKSKITLAHASQFQYNGYNIYHIHTRTVVLYITVLGYYSSGQVCSKVTRKLFVKRTFLAFLLTCVNEARERERERERERAESEK